MGPSDQLALGIKRRLDPMGRRGPEGIVLNVSSRVHITLTGFPSSFEHWTASAT